jgi:HTH-type transcriptional regulator/antitoxin HigA
MTKLTQTLSKSRFSVAPIKNDQDYEIALQRIEQLMAAEPNTPEFDELEVLSILVDTYEDQHYPINLPDPISAIKFRMEQLELNQKDLVPYIGSPSRVSEILSGKRSLSLSMIRSLHKNLKIPLEMLVQMP